MQFETKTLKNGLNTLFIDAPGNTSACVQIWFRAGSALEKYENEGIAHFLEHMFFKGTPTRPGSQIAHEVESFGGEVNAFTSFDYTCYYINSPCTHIKNTVDILMDMVSNPQFLKEDIIPERGVVFEEYRRSQDNPNQFSFQKMQEGVFQGAYSHPILGREETIKKFSKAQLNKFRKAFYNLSNATLVIAGDLKKDQAKLEKTIEKYSLPKGKPSSFPKFELKKKAQICVHQKDVRMSQLTLMVEAPSILNSNAVTEDLSLSTLGHGESSKLYQSLVMDDSLANASATSTMFMKDGGLHFIRVSFPHGNFEKICNRVYSILESTYKEGLTTEEIQKIKNQYIASKVYERESLESFAFNLGYGLTNTGNIKSDEEFIEKARKSSTASINQSFKEIFKRPFHISLQIPKSEKTSSVKKTLKKLQTNLNSISKKGTTAKKKELSSGSRFDPQVRIIKLKKGVSLLYRHNPMTPTFVLHSYLKGGLTEETSTNNGIYHLLTGAIGRGYKGIAYEKLKYDLEQKSAQLHHFAGKNAYGSTLHGQSEHSKELFAHFFGSLLTPTMESKFLKHEKELTLRNIESQEEDPVRQCFKRVNQVMFDGHPYSMSTLGSIKSVKKITKKNIEDLHHANVKNKEILITYCGDLELEEVKELLKPHTDLISPRPEKKLIPKKYTPKLGETHKINFEREQTQIFIGIPTGKLESSENNYLKILTTVLQGQSSELFVDVRDKKGLCYSAQPVHFTALEGGYWGIYMASGHDKVEAATEAIDQILEKYRKIGISKSDFNRVKKMIEGQTLLNIQTNDDYANIYSVPTLQGQGVDYHHKKNQALIDMKHEDFQKGIKKVLSKKWTKILVGKNL